MTTQEVANQLVGWCREGQYQKVHEELYHNQVVSLEPEGMPNWRAEGIQAIKAKGEQWANMVEEVHGAEISEPLIAGNHFSITMKNDVTFKGRGRQQIEEVCVYEVAEGKVVKEQFFYPVAPPVQQ